jgi:hypothetical protein
MKITVLEESADFATVNTKKLFSKLKSHELSRKGHPNHDASLSSKALIISAHVGGHDANPTNTIVPSDLEFVLSSLTVASDEQYESITDNEIVLLARKFHALHKFHKERRDHLGPASSAATSPTSSPIVPRGRSSTPPTSTTITTTTTGTTSAIWAMTRRRRRRSFRRSCPEYVLP